MGAAITAAPYGCWATNPTKKLAHWVYLLGQPLSRNRVFQNFSGEPPSLYTRYPFVARALGLAVQPLGRVRARAKESCIQTPPPLNRSSVLTHSTLEFRDFSKRAPGS